ncbi:hypothetical protein [Plantactinospora sonchi]|uniref:Uncharacterized protein n=1 Tax=Plantactinospora sonchi TaxID=1544735 RepID=A0ABU7S291_9ACTN
MTQNATLPSRAIGGAFLPAIRLAKIRRRICRYPGESSELLLVSSGACP